VSIPRVLLVDDADELRKLMRLMLRQRYAIDEASNADDALEHLRAGRPDLMVLDINMPGSMDGLQLLERLRGEPAAAPRRVVMLTAGGRPSDRWVADRLAVDAYVTKPFSPLALVDCIDRLVAQDRSTP
jgi:CheY-like chemotaxis protein